MPFPAKFSSRWPLTAAKAAEASAMEKDHEAYLEAFREADSEKIEKFCYFPLAYAGSSKVRSSSKYPFDMKKLQAKTGFAKAESRETILAIDDKKCHLLIEARRLKEDGSLAQLNSAAYILLKENGVWKTAAFSGILTDAADATPEE